MNLVISTLNIALSNTFDLYSTLQEKCIGKLCTAVCYVCFYMALNAANIFYSFSSLHDFQENVNVVFYCF